MGSYSQQRSSPIHEASLVDPSLHSPALLELLDIKLSRPVFGKLHSHNPAPVFITNLSSRVRRRLRYWYCGLCHGPSLNICTRPQGDPQPETHRILKIRNKCPHKGRSDHPRRPRCSRLCRSSKATFTHCPRGVGLWTCFPRCCDACEQGT